MTKISFRPFGTLTLTAAAALAAASPAPAADTNQQAPTTAQPPSQASDQPSDHPNRRVCVRAGYTGTRVARLICKTEAQWEAEGGIPGRE